MSMISALIDELNKSADEWNNSNMFELARMCREAVDTIWQLRDDLQRTNAEADKLREERREYQATIDSLVDECADHKAENAKLRELVQDFDKCLTEAVRLAYIQGHATIYDGTLLDSLHPRMRELGIEVES